MAYHSCCLPNYFSVAYRNDCAEQQIIARKSSVYARLWLQCINKNFSNGIIFKQFILNIKYCWVNNGSQLLLNMILDDELQIVGKPPALGCPGVGHREKKTDLLQDFFLGGATFCTRTIPIKNIVTLRASQK